MKRICRFLPTAALLASVLFAPAAAQAQIGQLISPGPLSAPHSKLEGVANCAKCHEQGKQVSSTRCLDCHKAIASRIAAKKGVHRKVQNDCVSCHVEHAGRTAELRPFDTKRFDHLAETGFALDGKHTGLECLKCHKKRSFLDVDARCSSCHKDAHAGKLGPDCANCHATTTAFKESGRLFDHAKTRFALEGGHRTVPCAKCHINQRYKDIPHESCTSCHRNPHKANLGTDCTKCHTAASWKVRDFDHGRTGTPLTGRHQAIPCVKCHTRAATEVRLKMAPCSTCHVDPHRGQFKKDCGACHDTRAFKGAAFDHSTTRFALEGKHREVVCTGCHKRAAAGTADFRGLKGDCASCHRDPHQGKLGTSCGTCHTAVSFAVKSFSHPRFSEFFGGQHAAVPCDKCHRVDQSAAPAPGAKPARVYKNVPTDCGSCHRDPHMGQLPRCSDCHAVDAAKFAAPRFRHDGTRFPLTGKHAGVACAKCHRSESGAFPSGSGSAVRYRGLPTDCAACHKDVHLGQVGTDCASCHNAGGFALPAYTHRNPGIFFRGRHAVAKCAGCHKRVEGDFPAGRGTAVKFTGVAASCTSCHTDPHAGQLGASCEQCHSFDASWKNASRAFHKAGLFPLEGRHLETPCGDCHKNGVLKGTPTRCYDCHWIRRHDDRYATRLGNDCEDCHRPTSWSAVTFEHTTQTGFAIGAAHSGIACDQCHRSGLFSASTPTECESCHLEDFRETREPDHEAAGFPLVCQLCHRPDDSSFRVGRFDHATFALAGVHTTQRCDACHAGNVFAGTPRDCVTCHREDVQAATNPNHAAAGFSSNCESCHRFTDPSWKSADYPHTVWRLVGQHATANCNTCHRTTVYAGLATGCVSCHRADFDGSKDPAHVAAGFPVECEVCHKLADASWDQGLFDHSTFALAGAHTNATCAACHTGGVYRGTSRECVGCHRADYDTSKEPKHSAAGFATTCQDCHQYADPDWKQARFNHSTFLLAGNHLTQTCAACHVNDVYAGAPRACEGCHRDDFDRTTVPNHVAARFPATCDSCHRYTDSDWKQARYDHSTFLLAGNHLNQVCLACHTNNVYAGTPRVCDGCHHDDFTKTTAPNHAATGFPTTCDTCHRYTDPDWKQGRFDHLTFQLLGDHATQVCLACHVNNVYAGTPRVCDGCHRDDFNKTTDPNHVAAGFPTSCEPCHLYTDADWKQGRFNHSSFPLAGDHVPLVCAACHSGGVYAGTSRTCDGCHHDDFTKTTNPNHIATGFPTTCETCHKFADPSWDLGKFNHDTFPLLGNHATQVCLACHPNNVYAGTSRVCSGCHLDEYNGTNSPGHAAAGFPTTCDTCHRYTDTSWNQGVFTHSAYTLRGVHLSQPCVACHSGGYAGTPTTCAGCHLADYNGATAPNHAAAGFPTTCEPCHKATDSSWNQGVFNHRFPITSGRHSGFECIECHTNPSNFVEFNCLTCHPRGETDGEHRDVVGYFYGSLACYACHPNGTEPD